MPRAEPSPASTWALIAAGGTAGHVVPGLAIADALVERGHSAAGIHFLGSERGPEARLVPESGYSVTLLPGRGIRRRLSFANVGAVIGLVRALGQAVRLVGRTRPAVVVALGGYASAACAVAAILRRVPLVVAEQNAVPGIVNRLLARSAREVAVSFPGTALPHATLTGNPVRAEIRAVARRDRRSVAREAVDVGDDETLLAVFGGSLGALRINEATIAAAGDLADLGSLWIRHVLGSRDWATLGERARATEQALEGRYRPIEYESDMPTLLRAADLVVCRAGATTIAELAVVGVPGILVPYPAASGDHQTANARFLERAGAAVVVPDEELDRTRLTSEVRGLISDRRQLKEMALAAHGVGRPDAAERVVDLIESHARST